MKFILMNENNKLKELECWIKLSDIQKAAIESGLKQLDQGIGITHEKVMEELKKKYKLNRI